MLRRLLIVATASIADADVRPRVREHAGEDAEILVVAPASDFSRLDWLTNADDDARAEAAGRRGDVLDWDLVVLCRACHFDHHERMKLRQAFGLRQPWHGRVTGGDGGSVPVF